MSEFLQSFLSTTWGLIAEMAPYLMLGFAAASLLHWLVRPERIQRWLGKPGIATVAKSCLIGVPMPLCSCSVIPVAASLRKNGASRGATAAFLSSTPQTGVDSILATYGMMGGLFATIRISVAFITGLAAGLLVDLFATPNEKPKLSPAPKPPLDTFSPLSPSSAPTAPLNALSLTPPQSAPPPNAATKNNSCCCSSKADPKHPSIQNALRYGWLRLPADLAVALLCGFLLAGLIATCLPADLLSGHYSSGMLAFALATLISVPLYVCATASIPLAYSFIAAGLSPGAALIFLIVGPATNTATIAAVWSLLGRKATAIYLSTLVVIAWLAGWLFNLLVASRTAQEIHLHAHKHSLSPLQHAAGIVLVLLLLIGLYNEHFKQRSQSCCAS
ncbi:SO_0444 family Cu/Zn efflux transporter [Coraliomargarita akajimensis]|uniref:Permease n=1 Tax=Coraliomargarita akajimensis (strain DSM 45221 / IAM 15411 / JCM 23193 / KCTC 12865 / 04OKA010-24) TaxID=583355 RepID=D5ELT9_CORAD|nr:SO_0444 family Cu/Zn efflux transporter [Coraliomargarita akajimensis]ADE53264.1 permease [Coraliomargarita akajimensis DSM 45221]